MAQKFTIAARSALIANISAMDTSLTVDISKADLYPVADTGTDPVPTVGKDFFKVVLQDNSGNIEVVYVRTRTLGSASMTNLLRGQEGTTARAYLAGSIVGLRHTAVDLADAISFATGASAFWKSLVGQTSAALSRVALGVSSIGDALFTAVNEGAAQTTLGFSTFFKTLIGAGDALAARATLGAAASGGNTDITSLSGITSLNGGQLAGFRNKVINGGMQIWQLSTSSTIFVGLNVPQILSTTGGYAGVDRFFAYCSGVNVGLSRVAGPSAGTFRAQLAGAAGVTAVGFGHRIESLNAVAIAGGTATLSVKLKNTLLTTVTWAASYATTTDYFGTISAPAKTLIATGSFTVSGTEAAYSASFSVPAAAATGIEIVFSVGGQVSGTFTIGDVQLEAGAVATPFEWRLAATELQLCQRYRVVNVPGNTSPDCEMVLGVANSTTQAMFVRPFPVQMKRREVSFLYAGSGSEQLYCFRTGTAGNVPASCTMNNSGTTSAYMVSTWTASPPTMVAGDAVRWAVADAILCFTTEI